LHLIDAFRTEMIWDIVFAFPSYFFHANLMLIKLGRLLKMDWAANNLVMIAMECNPCASATPNKTLPSLLRYV
jgi:hypothetical protein